MALRQAQGRPLRLVGIDPGTWRMGYAVLEGKPPFDQAGTRIVAYGVLAARPRLSLPQRLMELYSGICDILDAQRPQAMAIEEPFVGRDRSPRSALAVGRAQAVAMLAAAQVGIPVFTYSPATVKQAVTGYGAGSKGQVQEMVRLQLGLKESPPEDAADALAVALCHLRRSHIQELLEA